MYKHILIPTDGSPLSQAALDYGVKLARATNAHMTVLTVMTPFPAYSYAPGFNVPDDYSEELEKWADEVLARAGATLTAQRIEHETIKVRHEQPYQAILDTAKQQGCDLIVMASHGRRGLSAVVLGSETVKVLTHSTIPVLVYRGKA